ncbi:MAG TPA: S-layer homology domain-containing protein, partial [Chloroflexia bacterium]|nr:S-layer homology domain-containing protein [Chloroflexia bacterium]
ERAQGAAPIGPSPTSTPPCGTPSWRAQAPYPIAVRNAAMAAQSGLLYTFGGAAMSGPVTDANRYDPATNSWTPIAPLPAAREAAAATSDGQYIYILSGLDTSFQATATLYRYDPATNSYTTLAPSPFASTWQMAVYLNGQIYRLGGCAAGCSAYTQTVDVYTVSTDTWAPAGTVAPYPLLIRGMAAVAYGGFLYTGGGYGPGGHTTKAYRYDPATNTWSDSAVTDLPLTRSGAANGVLDGRWILAAGYVNGGVIDGSVVALDLNAPTGPWLDEPPLAPRVYAVGASAAGAFYAVGGGDANFNPIADNMQLSTTTCATATATAPPASTATATAPPATHTPTVAPPNATATPCPVQFTDVPPTDPFYPYIRCLVCRGIISGYADNTFRGGNNLTRGQAAKLVGNAAGFSDPVPTTQQTFEDVPSTDPFWVFIERLAGRGYISGYACGAPPAGACVPPANRPYFLTFNNITRGQISKVVANSAGLNNAIPSTQQTFSDVPNGNAFWIYIERLAVLNVISGYNCGGPGEPCDGQNRPYCRWTANVTRNQAAKIVANTFFPNCHTSAWR